MKDKFENFENRNKPNWNKDQHWENISKKIQKNKKGLLIFPILKYAAAACILLSGWIWGYFYGTKTYVPDLVLNKTPQKDTVYLTHVIRDTLEIERVLVQNKFVNTSSNVKSQPKLNSEIKIENVVTINFPLLPKVEVKIREETNDNIGESLIATLEPLESKKPPISQRPRKVYGKNVNIGTIEVHNKPQFDQNLFDFNPFGLISHNSKKK